MMPLRKNHLSNGVLKWLFPIERHLSKLYRIEVGFSARDVGSFHSDDCSIRVR